MSAPVDLRQLAVRRDAAVAPTGPRPRRSRLTRYALPAVLLLGFGALLTYAAWDTLSPPRPVTVAPVLTSRGEVQAQAGTPLFGAAGWVEPRPTPTLVTALAEGVVEELLVVEGQEVKRGDVVARLVAADAKLAVETAEAELELREAELASARAAAAAARVRLEFPTHLEAELAEADAALARAETELALLPTQLATAEARLATARQDWQGKKTAQLPAIALAVAEADVRAAENTVEEIKTRQKRVPVEAEAMRRKREAAADRLRRKTDEARMAGEGDAAVKAAEARLRAARAALDTARLRLERMTVRAPVAGRILALVARPGSRLMGQDPRGMIEASTVVTMYDPARLQVRVDVRLDDVGKVLSGQRVTITSAALGGRAVAGEVLLPTALADIQKNTLSVKVAIQDPPPVLRPEMLVQVTFLAPPQTAPAPGGAAPVRLLVPRALVETSAGGARVWVADRAAGRARSVAVQLGMAAGDLVEVTSGLDGSARLIVGGRDGLQDGQRISVTGEDDTLGAGHGGKAHDPKHKS